MKKLIAAILMIFSATLAVAESPSVTGGLSILSSYQLPNGFMASNKPVVQGFVDVFAKNGVYGELWASKRLVGGETAHFGNETDGKVGWLCVFYGVRCDVSVTFIDRFPTGTAGSNDIINPVLILSPDKCPKFAVGEICPFYKGELVYMMGGQIDGATVNRVGIKLIGKAGPWSWTGILDRGHYQTMLGSTSGNVWNAEAIGGYSVNRNWSVVASVRYIDPSEIKDGGISRVTRIIEVVGLRFAY
ncbi:MAG: hypothetical protein JWN37_650 [Candidatus Nomurabacteria bacterium]|nr:hypothetical protein [Candidatus Nomurabacteria bacterium]